MKKRRLLYCIIISFIFLFFLSKSSPLYKINDWYDAQCFFTVGKSMLNNRLPYLDLFEQKGPLLFFIYSIAAFFSSKSFIGVFILEVISYTIFLYYINKILELFNIEKNRYFILPILSMLILSSRSFTAGGSCEEFCFPILAITMYYFIKYLKTNKISDKETLLIGILSGCILWMKYTILGFSIGFCLTVLIKKIKEKDYKDLLRKILFFLLGIIITTLPWIIFFGIHKNGLKKLIEIYFLFNINSYSTKVSLIDKILNLILTIFEVSLKYFQYIILIFIPMLVSIKSDFFFKEKENNVYLLLSTFLLLIFIFIGGTNYRYYSLPIQPFMIFGIIYFFKYLNFKNSKIINIPIILLVTLSISFIHSPNTKFIFKEKSYYAQYEFSKNIKKNKTILNYGFLDGGFYFTTNTYPNTYFFQKNNIKYNLYKKNNDEQNKYIRKQATDYVITKKLNKKKRKLIEKYYELIDTHSQEYEEKKVRYYLYRKK